MASSVVYKDPEAREVSEWGREAGGREARRRLGHVCLNVERTAGTGGRRRSHVPLGGQADDRDWSWVIQNGVQIYLFALSEPQFPVCKVGIMIVPAS